MHDPTLSTGAGVPEPHPANATAGKALQARRRVAHLVAVGFLVALIAVLSYEGIATVRDDRNQPAAAQVALQFAQAESRGDFGAAWNLTAAGGRGGRSRSQWIAAREAPGGLAPLTRGTSYRVDAASLTGPYVRVLLAAGGARQPSLAVDLEYGRGGWEVRDLVSPGAPPPPAMQ